MMQRDAKKAMQIAVWALMLLFGRQHDSNAVGAAALSVEPPAPSNTTPSANQLRFATAVGTTQFITFNVCTFNDCEQDDLGSNRTYPATSFAPTSKVDTDQWVRVAMSWGAHQVCLTAHHSGGFALWQTNTTEYGLRNSPYMGGRADIVR